MTDEHLLTAAKLREQIRGRIEGDTRLYEHTGLVPDSRDRSVNSFVASVVAEDSGSPSAFAGTALGETLASAYLTDVGTEALHSGEGSVLSHLVGVTEQDLDASAVRLPLRLLDLMDNNGAPAFAVGAGNPNTGKTNTMLLLAELRKIDCDDLLVLSNFQSSITDIRVTSSHELAVSLLEHRERPKFVFIDEGSTHFDARTYRQAVATQWTPLAKRFAKIGVDVAGVVGHTGKDLHPEVKRMATMPYFKPEKKEAEFYSYWPPDSEFPADRLLGGNLQELSSTSVDYSPDDAAPWSWNLEAELFSKDYDWHGLLQELRSRGPQ